MFECCCGWSATQPRSCRLPASITQFQSQSLPQITQTVLDRRGLPIENRAMARLVLENVSKQFKGARRENVGAVSHLNLSVADQEFLVIVGPSGCGKTTTLRLIAGLETPDEGSIQLDGASLAGVPPRDRDVAMVFQNHALLPHLTAYENLAFGLMLRKVPKEEIVRRVNSAAEMLHLTTLLERKPPALSGGECQRVALGRALVRQPKVFLFDEPLSNLDSPMRLQLRGEITELRRKAGAMMIYVTHDQGEAMALADRVAVMRDGALQQIGSPAELYERPANRFVAGFMGSPPMNFVEGTLQQCNGALAFAGGTENRFVVPLEPGIGQRLASHAGNAVTLGLRPERILVAGPLGIEGCVQRIERMGPENLIYCAAHGIPFVLRTGSGVSARVGERLALNFDMAGVCFFDSATGNTI